MLLLHKCKYLQLLPVFSVYSLLLGFAPAFSLLLLLLLLSFNLLFLTGTAE